MFLLTDEGIAGCAARTAVSALVWGAVHQVASIALGALVPRKRLESLSPRDRLYLPEKVVSTIHGVAVGLGALTLPMDPAFTSDVLTQSTGRTSLLLLATAGYSVYDMVAMAWQREPPSMWGHHIATLVGTFVTLVVRRSVFFPATFLITELTVLPANIHWVLQRFEATHTPLYAANLAFRALAHLLFRVGIGPLVVTLAIVRHGGVAAFLRDFTALPVWLWGGNAFNVAFLSYLNVVWTMATVKRWRNHGRKPASARR